MGLRIDASAVRGDWWVPFAAYCRPVDHGVGGGVVGRPPIMRPCMTTGPEPSPQRRWYRRRWPWLAMAGLVITAWLARGMILGPFIAKAVADALTEATGGPASVERVEGGLVHEVRLLGVQAGAADEPAWQVRVARVEATYGLGLLRGDLAAVHRVAIDGVELEATMPASSSSPARPWPPLLARLPAHLPEITVAGRILLHAAGGAVDISGATVHLAGDRLEFSAERIQVAGRELVLPACVLRRRGHDALELAEPVRLDLPWLPIPLWCDQVKLTLGEQTQTVVAAGRIAGGSWQVDASAGATRLRLQGVDLAQMGLLPSQNGPLLIDADAEQVADGWAIRQLRLNGLGSTLTATGLVASGPWRCRDLVVRALVQLDQVPGLEHARGRVHATLRGTAELEPDRWRTSDLTLALTGDEVSYAGVPCTPLTARLSVAQGRVSIDQLALAIRGIEATAIVSTATTASGASPDRAGWQLHIPPISVVGGVLSGEVRLSPTGELDGGIEVDDIPIATLPGLAAVRHLQGTASGRLDLAGTLLRPLWRGVVAVAGLEIKLSSDVPTLTEGRARLTYADRIIVVEDMRGELGGSAIAVAGRITLSDGPPGLDLTCIGSNLLLTQRSDARVRADLDLSLTGTIDQPLLSGRVHVVNALITPDLGIGGGEGMGSGDGRLVLFELPDPPWSRMRFDIAIDALKTIGEADAGVRVATRWGRGRCDLDLRLRGNGALPEPEGRVIVREGVATLPFSTLKVTHGEIVFPSGDPFQPRLVVIAGARIRQYDLQVQVTGLLSQPVVRVSGSGLDEQEATFLLSTGSTPDELQDEAGQKAAIGRIGTWLGQETWRSIEGPEDYDAGPSLSERVTVTWGRELTAQGRDTIDSEVELTTPGSDEAVLLYGQRDRYDQYNAGIILRLYWGGEDE